MDRSGLTRPDRSVEMLALPIFPGRLQPSIVSRSELNFRVRDGNGWILALINTNYNRAKKNRTKGEEEEVSEAECLHIVGQALGRLVQVSFTHYCASTSCLSTR